MGTVWLLMAQFSTFSNPSAITAPENLKKTRGKAAFLRGSDTMESAPF
jgi:hypothetical protein